MELLVADAVEFRQGAFRAAPAHSHRDDAVLGQGLAPKGHLAADAALGHRLVELLGADFNGEGVGPVLHLLEDFLVILVDQVGHSLRRLGGAALGDKLGQVVKGHATLSEPQGGHNHQGHKGDNARADEPHERRQAPALGHFQIQGRNAADGLGLVHLVDQGGRGGELCLKALETGGALVRAHLQSVGDGRHREGRQRVEHLLGNHQPLVLHAAGGLPRRLARDGVQQGGGKAVDVAGLAAGGLGAVLLQGGKAGGQFGLQAGALPTGRHNGEAGNQQRAVLGHPQGVRGDAQVGHAQRVDKPQGGEDGLEHPVGGVPGQAAAAVLQVAPQSDGGHVLIHRVGRVIFLENVQHRVDHRHLPQAADVLGQIDEVV